MGLLASPAHSVPAQADVLTRVIKVDLEAPATTGRDVDLNVAAVNDQAPVNGVVMSFGNARDAFAISACQAQDQLAGALGMPFAPGSRSRLSVPLRFARAGRYRVAMRVDAGGCQASFGSVFQGLTVTATEPGERPVPPLIDEPTPLPLPGIDLPPPVPAPPVVLPPVSPPPVVLPPVLPLPRAATSRPGATGLISGRQRRCEGSGRRVGRSRKAVRNARIAVRCLLNKVRRRYRLPRLGANGRLFRAAGRHSRSMVVSGFFSHVAPGGVGLTDRVQRTGYFARTRRWTVGENLGYAAGSPNAPRKMLRAWMRSTPHRANILTRKYREIGLGVVPGIPGNHRRGATFTTVFGVRR